MPPATPPLKTYHHGDLRHAMLDAVAAVVREHGIAQVSLREVARRVGVSHTAAIHHFGNKAGLLTAFAAQGYVEMAESVLASLSAARPKDGPAMLEAGGRGYVKFAVRDPERFQAMFQLDQLNRHDPHFVEARDAAYSLLTRAITRCHEEGYIGTADVRVVAAAAWSLAHGLSALWISGRLGERIGATDPNDVAAKVTRLFVDSVLRGGARRHRRVYE